MSVCEKSQTVFCNAVYCMVFHINMQYMMNFVPASDIITLKELINQFY